MDLTVLVLVILAIVLVVILLWLLFGVWGKRREDHTAASPAPARSVNLPPSADVEVPEEVNIGNVNIPVVPIDRPEESAAPVSSYTYPTEEITESDALDADVVTTDVVDADVVRTEAVERVPDVPLESGDRDDLEIIEGIGPKIRAVLNEAGVTRFAQLAAMEPDRISEILQSAGLRIADPHSWPEQARLAANGDMEGLKSLQDRLTAGRAD